jgi:hypothetical protein
MKHIKGEKEVTKENQEERGTQIDETLKRETKSERETREKEKSQLNILQLFHLLNIRSKLPAFRTVFQSVAEKVSIY